ncbi:hypothetical protein PV327_000972 [Microctonus hyperodae]|uniref:C2H2-type domain-containing protein n=1 Tax=Microctonus hyperodae TaxID=165561 RepID=A0AA39G884_MICHY|nr:hypothetical protein PV327_000972 [Microctonus hyperodae]
MSELSPILRALRPRTLHKRNSSQKQEQADATESEEADGGASQLDDTEALKDDSNDDINNETKDDNRNDNGDVEADGNGDGDDDDGNNEDDDDEDDDDDDDDDEPRLTIKEEPEDNIPDDDVMCDRKYECQSCTPVLEFPTLVEYLQHLKDKHQQKTKCHECPHCNFICQHPKRLTRHIATSHKNKIQDDVSVSESGEYNRCSMCSFIAIDQADLSEHNKFHHLKRRFFRCTKCSYMTHVRARYTKHVKYHSMPMIKCDDCDFRTPYKWNLDRHTRNHGGGGTFQCRACNFTADIRQSLTVHETNHHEPPLGQLIKKVNNSLDRKQRTGVKRYNQVGASDFRDIPKISESSIYTNSSKSPMQIDIIENSVDDSNAIAGAECIALKCEEKGCQFITAWDSEMQRHLMESHAPSQSPNKSRKPMPMLIPLSPESKANNAVANEPSPSTLLKVPRVRVRPELAKIARDTEIAKLYNNREATNTKREAGTTNSFKKRNASFFDKIKERLMTTNANTGSPQVSVDGTNNSSTRRVFKCPHCPFWASTASRFHVHIVGHLNRKPFECSLCQYRSNWRWDITKHIKLKAARDPAHLNARVLMTDETGRRNYSKYNKYLAQMDQQSMDDPTNEECNSGEIRSNEPPKKVIIMNDTKNYPAPPSLTPAPINNNKNVMDSSSSVSRPLPPLQAARSQGQSLLKTNSPNNGTTVAVSVYSSNVSSTASTSALPEETKRTLWKCKRCNFRDANKETVLLHVKSHYEVIDQASTNERSNAYVCDDCPFIAVDSSSLALHQVHHRPNLEAIFKCYLCPYYVSTKAELLEHARLHGEELATVHQRTTNIDPLSIKSKPPNQSTSNENIRTNVSLEEITNIQLRNSQLNASENNSNNNNKNNNNNNTAAPPLLLDTRALPDTPLVWVSRPNGTFAKMLKCRHCPHVSSRRAEVRDHETMHSNASSSDIDLLIACPDCSFSCNKREIMDAHAEMHNGSLGTVHCLVDDGRTDAQQLDDLTTLLGLSKTPILGPEPDLRDSRLVHYCGKCPARFLCEKELRIHLRYHSTELAYSCEWCSYAARQPAHLLAHQKAHSNEYQERSRYLLSIYGHSQRYPPPRTACVETSNLNNSKSIGWIVVELSNQMNNFQNEADDEQKAANQVFTCTKCPARYFKLDALEYHMTLHGSNNRFQCTECDYSSKTAQNLMKHQVVHRRHTEASEPVVNTRLQSSSDPQFDTFIHGNPNFVYQNYVRNGRLKEKKYKCQKCPSAFEKREQFRVHLTLHGAKQRYRCDTCDYSVKYYANYVQHLKKHQVNAHAQVSRRQSETSIVNGDEVIDNNDRNIVNVAKTRRKSTISSVTNVGLNNLSSFNSSTMSSISNQDKQSILLMQKKGANMMMQSETNAKILRCHECPFSAIDKDMMDAHKRRHGLERLTPPCPHCNYVPRKDENIGDHVRLHFTRLYKPESYLVVELLSLTVKRINSNKKDDKQKDSELLFSECADGKYLPVNNASSLPISATNGNGFQEKVTVDPSTGEATHRFNL